MYRNTTNILGCSHDVAVSYDYFPGSFGKRENGVPIEPDEQGRVVINEVMINTSVGWISFDSDTDTDEQFAYAILEQQ